MAPRLRSRKIVDKSEKKDNLEQNLPSSDSPNQFDPDSSFNLPPPGPATQALIEQLAASETEIEGLDDIPECDLFDENNEVLIPNPPHCQKRMPHKKLSPQKIKRKIRLAQNC